MKSIHQIFLIIICVAIIACQTQAQNVKNVIGPNPADKIVSDQELIEKFENTGAFVKNYWKLYDPLTKEPYYHLYLPTAALAKAGIKVSTEEKAVPVYVETKDGGYEPLLTKKAGQHNQKVLGITSGSGSVITGDGFILTTRTVATPWKMNAKLDPSQPGITMSADLKRVVRTDTPPPDFWIPEETTPHNGMLGKFNIRVKSGDRYPGEAERLTVFLLDNNTDYEADLVSTSSRHDVGIIKIKVPGTLKKAELFDNYDSLKKGENLFIVIPEPVNFENQKMIFVPLSVSSVKPTDEMGDSIELTDNFDNSDSPLKNRAEEMRAYFAVFSYTGIPVYNKNGQVVGMYSAHKSKPERHYIVPIRYGIELTK